MAIVSAEVVESTWRSMAASTVGEAHQRMKELSTRQPELLGYVLAMMEDLRPELQEIAVYAFACIEKMFDAEQSHRVRKVSPQQIEARDAANEEAMLRLGDADDRFLERAAERLILRQPHVFQYMVEMLMESDEPELSAEDSGYLFMVLRNVIDLLDEACEDTPRS